MQARQISRTAEYMAFFRALESVRRPGQRLVTDPFARAFLRPSLRKAVALSKIPWFGRLVEKYADRRLPGARTSAVARTRLIDEIWCRALRDGIRQIVILGAGFDCRTYRLPLADSVAVFEVDHPDMLAFKMARLKRLFPAAPNPIRLAPIDFNRQSLAAVLTDAGFDPSLPALFLWEGVTNYLSEEAVDSVLRYIGGCSSGSRIVFTYVHRGVLDGSVYFEGGVRILQDVADIGEPWTFGLDPATLPEFLSKRNLQIDYDAGAAQYRSEIYGPPARQMRGYDFYRVAMAHVADENTHP
jgi:methyltransferase (TIGR00027 family)